MNVFDKPQAYEGDSNYIFISYSHYSSTDVYKILSKLNETGVHFWYDDNLENGVDWAKNVQEKIRNATSVWFFFDKNFFHSKSLQKEVEYVSQIKKAYSPIFYTGKVYKEIYRETLFSTDVDDDVEDILRPMFKGNITSIIFRNTKDFYDELIREAERLGVISGDIIDRRNKNEKKIAFVGKNSLFTKSILEGIGHVFSETTCTIDKVLLNTTSVVPLDYQLRDIISELLIKDYSGIIIRPIGEMSTETFGVFTQLCKKNRVLICDMDITPKQRRILSTDAPPFVCSDFSAGGKKLGDMVNRLCYIYGVDTTDIVICTGPKKNVPATIRSQKIIDEIKNTVLRTTNIIELDTLDAPIVFEQISTFFYENGLNGICDRNLIIYVGNDNAAYYLARNLEQIKKDGICIQNYKKIIILGYDGITGSTGNSILEETNLDYATIDAIPIIQGETVAHTILNMVNGIDVPQSIKVEPKIIKKITHSPILENSLIAISPLLTNAELFVFDLDGTMADTESLHWEAYNKLLEKKYGFTLTDDNVKKYIGNSEILIYKMIENDFGITIDYNSFLKERLAVYLELLFEKNLQPYKWVNDIKDLYKDIPIVLLTSQVPEIVNRLLSFWELDDLIPLERRISAHDGKVTKKDVLENPSSFFHIGKEIAPSSIAVFEDSEHVASMAQSLGYTVIGIVHKYNKDSLIHCDALINQKMKKGVFVGLGGLDMVYYVDKIPPMNEKTKTSNYKLTIGGPALKAAITCSKLGGNATLITGLGNNPLSQIIKDTCTRYNIRYYDIMPQKDIPNVSFVAINILNSSRTIVSGQTNGDFLRFPNTSFFEQFDYCLYDCNIPIYTKKLIQDLSSNNVPLVLDCGSWKDKIEYALNYSEIAISSEKFASPMGNDIFELGNDLHIKMVAQTRGGDDILMKYDGKMTTIKVEEMKNVNTLGAGDVLHGAFCYYYFDCELDYKTALENASKYATQYVINNR